jgi:hypothetical protein
VPLYILMFTIWNAAGDAHVVQTSPMPLSVCIEAAEKMNIPLIAPHQYQFGDARCVLQER